jgi:hypothetical protein
VRIQSPRSGDDPGFGGRPRAVWTDAKLRLVLHSFGRDWGYNEGVRIGALSRCTPEIEGFLAGQESRSTDQAGNLQGSLASIVEVFRSWCQSLPLHREIHPAMTVGRAPSRPKAVAEDSHAVGRRPRMQRTFALSPKDLPVDVYLMEMFERVRTVLGLPVFLNSVRGVAAALENAQDKLALGNSCSTEAMLAVIAEARNVLGISGQCDTAPDPGFEWDHACIAAHLASLLAEASVKEHPLELWAQGGVPAPKAESTVAGVMDSFTQAPIRRPELAPQGYRWKSLFARTNPWPDIWQIAGLRIEPTQGHEVKQQLIPVLRAIHEEAPSTDVELARVLVDVVRRSPAEGGVAEQESEPNLLLLEKSVRRWRSLQRTKTLWQLHLRGFSESARLCDPRFLDPILDAHIALDGRPSIASGLRQFMPTMSALATRGSWRSSYATYREELPGTMRRIEGALEEAKRDVEKRVEEIMQVAIQTVCRRALHSNAVRVPQ